MVRYIDAEQAIKVAVQHEPDHWIWPTYRRWFTLMILFTVLLLWVAR